MAVITSIYIAHEHQDPDDQYPAECWLRAQLMTWKQWVRGEGVTVEAGRKLGLSEETIMAIDNRRDDFRPAIVVQECERMNRAVNELQATDMKGWKAIECYHFVSISHRQIARAAKTHHKDVEYLLLRGHESLYEFYKLRASA